MTDEVQHTEGRNGHATGGTDRPLLHLTYLEGTGFGAVIGMAFMNLWPRIWFVGLSIAVLTVLGANLLNNSPVRSVDTETDGKGGDS